MKKTIDNDDTTNTIQIGWMTTQKFQTSIESEVPERRDGAAQRRTRNHDTNDKDDAIKAFTQRQY